MQAIFLSFALLASTPLPAPDAPQAEWERFCEFAQTTIRHHAGHEPVPWPVVACQKREASS